VLSRNPEWRTALSDFHIEGAIMVGDWLRVQQALDQTESASPAATVGKLLLAMKSRDQDRFYKQLTAGFLSLGRPITAAGRLSYNSSYESMVNLHVLHELKMFHEEMTSSRERENETGRIGAFPGALKGRLDSLLPSFKTREIVLSFRRAAYAIQ
jgi:serine/threonine-protein kinase ATR